MWHLLSKLLHLNYRNVSNFKGFMLNRFTETKPSVLFSYTCYKNYWCTIESLCLLISYEKVISYQGNICEWLLIPQVFERRDHVGLEVIPSEAKLLLVALCHFEEFVELKVTEKTFDELLGMTSCKLCTTVWQNCNLRRLFWSGQQRG